MPAVRQSAALARAASRALKQTQTSSSIVPTASFAATRSFSVTARRQGGGSDFDPPTGWLFGVKPGEKYEREGWEIPFYTLFCGGFAGLAVVLAFQPDTSLDTWALEEARRRLEKEGILPDPYPEKKQ